MVSVLPNLIQLESCRGGIRTWSISSHFYLFYLSWEFVGIILLLLLLSLLSFTAPHEVLYHLCLWTWHLFPQQNLCFFKRVARQTEAEPKVRLLLFKPLFALQKKPLKPQSLLQFSQLEYAWEQLQFMCSWKERTALKLKWNESG